MRVHQHLTQEGAPRSFSLLPPGAQLGVPLSHRDPCEGGSGLILQERKPRLREGLGSAGQDSHSVQLQAKPLFPAASWRALLWRRSGHNPAVQGQKQGASEAMNCSPGATIRSRPGSPHWGKATATGSPRQVVWWGWRIGWRGVELTSPSPFLCLTHCPLWPLSVDADLGGAFQSINSSPNKQVFQNRSLWISFPISFFNPDSCGADGGDPPAWETDSADALLVGTGHRGPGRLPGRMR